MMAISSSIALLTLALGFLGILLYVLRHLTYWRSTGIPYLQSAPVFGPFFPILLRKRSMAENTIDTYYACPGAKYVGCNNFEGPILLIKDPEIVKEIAVKSFAHFPNHRGFINPDFDPILAKNLFSLKDDRWRSMRTVVTPSFTANKMKFLFQLVSKCSTDSVQHLSEHPEITTEIDLSDFYTRYANDVIATAVFGINVNSLKDRANEFYMHGKEASPFGGLLKLFKLVATGLFPNLSRSIGLSFLPRKTDRFFKQLIRDTVKIRDERSIVRPDLIHLLMQARDNENGIEMTIDDITAQAVIFFFAGFDTSSRLMCFMSHVLSYHPEIQDRLRKEVDDILGGADDEIITYEKLGRLKYMDMVISETLRLYPPQPFTDRVCSEPYELPPSTPNSKPFTVLPNTLMWIPTIGFHRDPNYFPEPEKFDPERFSEENKKKIKPYTYFPFGFGPRKCIGERFALMEAKIIMAHLLQKFVFKPSNKTTKSITFVRDGSMLNPEKGFWVNLESRHEGINS